MQTKFSNYHFERKNFEFTMRQKIILRKEKSKSIFFHGSLYFIQFRTAVTLDLRFFSYHATHYSIKKNRNFILKNFFKLENFP
jgi:hypothetical protein